MLFPANITINFLIQARTKAEAERILTDIIQDEEIGIRIDGNNHSEIITDSEEIADYCINNPDLD